MTGSKRQSLWNLAREQHGVVTRRQLLDAGLSGKAIDHRRTKGRLHPVHRGVYAVGRAELTRHGRWMAAVLACGADAVLSHASAGALYELSDLERRISISLPSRRRIVRPGIEIHRVDLDGSDTWVRDRIPVTSPSRTIADLASVLDTQQLARAVKEADVRGLVSPPALRSYASRHPGRPGVPALRDLLDPLTFRLTDSVLEQRFLRLVRRAGLPLPETGVRLNGFTVDFYWLELGLVVETDGLTYHRTELQQARDRRRDRAHAEAGLTTLRFTHREVADDGEGVMRTLRSVAARLGRSSA